MGFQLLVRRRPLPFVWRRTGNLAAPALAHTLIDAVRNGLQAGL